nr:hypothetical protein L204_02511 [Cryptococcus depauperatus CBS 7855]
MVYQPDTILTGSENYALWKESISATLVLKDLEIFESVTLNKKSIKADRVEHKRRRQVSALILKFLSPDILDFRPVTILNQGFCIWSRRTVVAGLQTWVQGSSETSATVNVRPVGTTYDNKSSKKILHPINDLYIPMYFTIIQ